MSHAPFSGVITAIATPFKIDGSIDSVAFQKLLRSQKQAGIHGVVVSGTTGESPTLSEEEKTLLVKLALDERTDSFHVYVGTGSNDTKETIEASVKYSVMKNAKGVVPDGVMAVVPYYNKPNQSGLLAHFNAVAQAVPNVPFCVYNVPGRTGAALAPATFLKIAKNNQNVVAIKEAAGDVRIVTELRRGLQEAGLLGRVRILSGDDPTYAPALLCGAHGVISVTSHVIPEAMLGMLKAAQENNVTKLQELHLATYPVNTDFFCAPNPVPLKWALAELGMCENILRLPLVPLEEKEIATVRNAMRAVEQAGIRFAK